MRWNGKCIELYIQNRLQKISKILSPQVFRLRERILQKCLPESGRCLELSGRHGIYCDIESHFDYFWCMFDDDDIIGAVAIKTLENQKCELKSFYLPQKYHGKGLGNKLLTKAIYEAKKSGYSKMYLDTLSTSKRAIALYERAGFIITERYNENRIADVFMVLDLTSE